MNDDDRYGDAQSPITCPYNTAHTFPKFRLARHLVKCRKQHVEEAKELKQCPFNATHVVPLIELQYHETVCPDREAFYTYTHRLEDSHNRVVEELNENTMVHLEVPSTENWDDEVDTSQNIIAACRENAEKRGVLQSNSNAPPAERKALRQEQRAKMRERMNLEEEQRMAASTSRGGSEDTRSVASYRTIASTSTDVTFNTARNTTQQYMCGIAPPDSSQIGSSRGRGKVIPKQKASEVGLGRGRKM